MSKWRVSASLATKGTKGGGSFFSSMRVQSMVLNQECAFTSAASPCDPRRLSGSFVRRAYTLDDDLQLTFRSFWRSALRDLGMLGSWAIESIKRGYF